jgi:hypothetical protein
MGKTYYGELRMCGVFVEWHQTYFMIYRRRVW